MPDISGFDRDEFNIAKCRKHGVTAQEIEALLRGTPLVAIDRKHSSREERFLAVGKNGAGRYIFVIFTLRQRNRAVLLRPISARYMHRKEIDRYETKSTAFQK